MQKPWVEAVISSHVWKASLPANLGVGAHRLTVRARDEYGRELVAPMVLEVAERDRSVSPA